MTGPEELGRPEQPGETGGEQRGPSGPSGPGPGPATTPPGPAATGWPGRPEAPRPGSQPGPAAWTTRPLPPVPASQPRPEGSPGQPAQQQRPAAPAGGPAPVRPPVPTGVPPRPAPLPPPRTTGAPEGVTGSLASATVVPEGVRRSAPRPTARPAGARPVAGRGRRAKLAVKRLDPWSVFVTSLVLSLLLGVITIIASVVLYLLLSALGVPASINDNVGPIADNSNLLTQGRFVGIATLVAGANVVFLTLLATVGAMLYNLVSTFTGGLELTLAERD